MITIKILIIEDNPGDIELIREMLQAELQDGFSLSNETRLKKGIESLKENDYDVILLDLLLPDSTGFDTLVKLLVDAPTLPIVVLTGLEQQELAIKAVHLGAQDCLKKGDISSSLLVKTLQYAIERKENERKIKKQGEFLETVIDSFPHPFYVIDINDHSISLTNSVAEKLFGETTGTCYALTNGLKRPCSWDNHPCPIEEVKKTRQPVKVEHVHRYNDGTEKIVEVQAFPIIDDDGEINRVIEYTQDITERKKVEDALRESEEKYHFLFDHVPIGIGIADVKGNVIAINEVMQLWTGYSIDDFQDINIADTYVHPSDREKVLEKLLEIGRVRDFETKLKRKDGTVYRALLNVDLVELDGKKLLLTTMRDITERKQAEEALQKARQKYQMLVEMMEEVVFLEDAKGRIVFVNRGGAETLGYTKEEILGKHWSNYVPDQELEKIKDEAVKRPKGIRSAYEAILQAKDGRYIPVIVTATPIFSKNGEFEGVLAVFTNITKLKQAEEILKHRIEMERLISFISKHLINVTPDDLDIAIYHALQAIGEFSYADHTFVFLITDDGRKIVQVYEWTTREIEPLITIIKGKDSINFPWIMEKLSKFEIVQVPNLENLPPSASDIKEIASTLGLKSFVVVPMVKKGSLVGILGFTSVHEKKIWSKEDIMLLNMAGNIFVSALERKRAEEELIESEKRFTAFMKYLPGKAFMKDSQGRYIYMNETCEKVVGAKYEDWKGKTDYEFLPSDVAEQIKANDRQVMTVGSSIETIENVPQIDGVHHWLAIKFPIMDAKGKPNILAGMSVDITERKQMEESLKSSLEEKEILLREIHHRVKNNLQIISSLLQLQSESIRDEQTLEILEESQNRVRVMALIHERLYRSRDLTNIDFTDYIHQLATDLLSSYKTSTSTINLVINASDIFLDINTAINCGLIINELISNCLKHAFPRLKEGSVHINFSQDRNKKYELIVSDDGVGFPKELDFRKTDSLGLRIVNILTKQLDGSIEFVNHHGTEFKIKFPV
ncbi:MAG: PAS domain S-box protein [Candidatus Hodarchaeales archaeon]